MRRSPTRRTNVFRCAALVAALSIIAAACSSDTDGTSSTTEAPTTETSTQPTETTTVVQDEESEQSELEGRTVSVYMVYPPPPGFEQIQALTEEHFTGPTGIFVEYLQPGKDMAYACRDLFQCEESPPQGVLVVDSYSASVFGNDGRLENLRPAAESATGYDVDDLIPSVRAANGGRDGETFALPFYAESSFIMFNQQIMDDNGIDFPANPTWDQIDRIARQVHTDDVAGICLRTNTRWDELGFALTTVVNTFGGTWWERNDDGTPGIPQIDQDDSGFRAATEFYIDLLSEAGPDDVQARSSLSSEECLDQFVNGDVAIWYDSTASGPLVEADESPVAGNVGYTLAPTNLTDASGWLQSYGLAIPTGLIDDLAMWEYVRWATSPDTSRLIGETFGWASAPGTRLSIYDTPEYIDANQQYVDVAREAITTAPIDNPGTSQRPGAAGIQYVGIELFPTVAESCLINIEDALWGIRSVDDVLEICQMSASFLDQSATVPNVIGLPISLARMAIEQAGLLTTRTFVDSSGVPTRGNDATPALVIGQNPPASARRASGTNVELVLEIIR